MTCEKGFFHVLAKGFLFLPFQEMCRLPSPSRMKVAHLRYNLPPFRSSFHQGSTIWSLSPKMTPNNKNVWRLSHVNHNAPDVVFVVCFSIVVCWCFFWIIFGDSCRCCCDCLLFLLLMFFGVCPLSLPCLADQSQGILPVKATGGCLNYGKTTQHPWETPMEKKHTHR